MKTIYYEDRDELISDLVEAIEFKVKVVWSKECNDKKLDEFINFMDDYLEDFMDDGWGSYN